MLSTSFYQFQNETFSKRSQFGRVEISSLRKENTKRKLKVNAISNMSLTDAKRNAASQAVDDCVQSGMRLGIGSGATVVFAIERIAERAKLERLQVVCVPTSFQARQLIIDHNLMLGDLDRYQQLDVHIDGVDEVDDDLVIIKGGGGCLLQEKIVASCAKLMVVVGDYTKKSALLGDQYKRGLPIEVVPMAYKPLQHRIEHELGGKAVLRMAKVKLGPCLTDNGNFILDWQFDLNDCNCNWKKIDDTLHCMPGVIETGLFVNMASRAYFGMADGTVAVMETKAR